MAERAEACSCCILLRDLDTGRAYESIPEGDPRNPADCAYRHPDRRIYDPRGDGASSFLTSQEGELDGSLRASRHCGSTAMADSCYCSGPGSVGRGEEARKRCRAYCGPRSRSGVLAVSEAGKPCKTKSKRQCIGIAAK